MYDKIVKYAILIGLNVTFYIVTFLIPLMSQVQQLQTSILEGELIKKITLRDAIGAGYQICARNRRFVA